MINIKKIAKNIGIFLIMLLFAVPIVCNAESWCVNRAKNHEQPALDDSFNFIEKYNTFYLDSNATPDDKVIYLTFDAGYENGNIERILDALKKHNAKGAFFILENLIIRNPELVKRMVSEGHLVCNHTAKHPDMTKITDINNFKNELDKLESVYKEYIGQEMSKYYRPPEGKFSEQNLDFANKLGYKTVFWSFAYADWDNDNQPSEESAIQKIKDNTHNGMIVLLHPTSETNANIMDNVLTYWEREGYRFGTLDEL